MPRYIDADALRARMYREAFETDTDMQKWDSGCWIRYKLFENCIDSAPTLSPDDLRGVGEWEKDSDGLDVCSECGEIALQRVFIKLPDKIVDLQMVRSKFCPNCGARLEVSEDA